MKRLNLSVRVLGVVALFATVCLDQVLGQPPEASTPAQEELAEVIELPRQTLTFKPTRDDITVGSVVLSLHHSDGGNPINLAAIRVNGSPPKTKTLYLKQIGKNQFEVPAVKIAFSRRQLRGPLYLTAKVWFNELTNQYDSHFYEHVDDRYALLSYCTDEDDDPTKVNARLGANRMASVEEFRERLSKPFVIKLNQRPLREEWGRWPMINSGRTLSDADLKAIEQLVRDRGERYLISISASRPDHASIAVGEHNVFESMRSYALARTGGQWRIEKVEELESGW